MLFLLLFGLLVLLFPLARLLSTHPKPKRRFVFFLLCRALLLPCSHGRQQQRLHLSTGIIRWRRSTLVNLAALPSAAPAAPTWCSRPTAPPCSMAGRGRPTGTDTSAQPRLCRGAAAPCTCAAWRSAPAAPAAPAAAGAVAGRVCQRGKVACTRDLGKGPFCCRTLACVCSIAACEGCRSSPYHGWGYAWIRLAEPSALAHAAHSNARGA